MGEGRGKGDDARVMDSARGDGDLDQGNSSRDGRGSQGTD